MGQNGSSRWAAGKSDFANSIAPIDFPQWQSYLQILTHYYTGIQVVRDDGTGNRTALTPDFRWNMLRHQTDPLTPAPGSPFSATLVIQNSGVLTWPAGSGYPLSYWWVNSAGQPVISSTLAGQVADQVSPGAVTTLTLNVVSPPGGPYTLTWRLAGPLASAGASWPQPHFDAANTRANPVAGPLGQITTLWQASGGDSYRFHTLVADATQGYYQKDGLSLEACDLFNGLSRWTYFFGGPRNGALADGYYVAGQSSTVIALNTANGSRMWQRDLSQAIQTDLVTADHWAYLVAASSSYTYLYLYGLNVATSAIQWGSARVIGDPPYWYADAPQIPAVEGGRIYVAYHKIQSSSRLSLSVYSATTGILDWTTDVITASNAGNLCAPTSPPLLAGGRAFLGIDCEGYKVAAVNIATHRVDWLISGVLTDTFTQTIDSLAYTATPPQLLVTGAGKIWTLNPANGQKLWHWQPPSGQPLQTAATVAGDRIWIASGAATTWRWYALSLNGVELDNWTAPAGIGLPGRYPALAGDWLLFTTDGSQHRALATGPGPNPNWFDQLIPPAVGSGGPGPVFLPIVLKNA